MIESSKTATPDDVIAIPSGDARNPAPVRSILRRCLVLLARWAPAIVGCAFLYYGSGKLFSLNYTVVSIDFVVNQKAISNVLAVLVTVADLYMACLLLFAERKKWPIVATLATLTVYSLYLLYLVTMENPPDCGCGGLRIFESNRAGAWAGITRNLFLAGLLACALRYGVTKQGGDPADTA